MGLSNVRSGASKKADAKFDKKVQFYSKVREAVALGAKKSIEKKNKNARKRQKKLKVYDLSALTDFLPDVNETQQAVLPPKSKVNCKSRQKMVLKESQQVMKVLSHGVFQSDPLSAIYRHLKSTQPHPETMPEKKSNDDRKKKKKKSKSSSRVQSMEM